MAAFCVNGAFDCGEVKLLEHRNAMINIVTEVADRIVLATDDINRKIFSGPANHIRCCNIFHNFNDVVIKADGASVTTKAIMHILADDILIAG